MKILVFGAGVIGTTYAWQLSEAGYDVSLLVRKHKLIRYSHSGVSINCIDLRGKKKEFVKTVFRPKTTDRLDPKDGYDLIIVSVKSFQVNDAASYISRYAGQANILFLCNLWDCRELLQKHFPTQQTFCGFPAMAGGGKTDNAINCLLFKNKHTILGQPDGKHSPELRELARMMKTAGMQPKISKNANTWLKAHYVSSATTFAAACKAGDAVSFATNYPLVKQSVLAIREGFRLCKKDKANPSRIFPFSLFYLPLFIVTPLLKRHYNTEFIRVMEAKMKHGFDEMKAQYHELLKGAKKHDIKMLHFASFEKHIADAEKSKSVNE